MGNRKKKGKRSPSNQKPQFTSKAPATATADNSHGNLFTQIITLYRKPPPPGGLWEKHLKIYHMLHSTEAANNHRCKIYRDALEKIILEAIAIRFSRVQYTNKRTPGPVYIQTSPPRPANLVATMDDALANEMFFMVSKLLGLTGGRASLFGGGTGTLTEVFGEQLFIAFLEWLLKNNRPYFEMLEDHRPLKEYTEPASSSEGDQPAPANQTVGGNPQESLFQQYQRAHRPPKGKFYETHLDIYQQLQQQNEKKYNHYKVFEMLAINHLIGLLNLFRNRELPIPPPPARLVTSMKDEDAVVVFIYINTLLRIAGFRVSSMPDFKEQLVIGVLEWMLEYKRSKFDDIESNVIKGLNLKENL